MWRSTPNLISMLSLLPKECTKVFGESLIKSYIAAYVKMKMRLAFSPQNPRLLRIGFHTFRHWKATQLYHETKDLKDFPRHKCLKSTEVYINIERTLFESGTDRFTVNIAQTPDEIKEHLETGFEYVCQKENPIFMRKRK